MIHVYGGSLKDDSVYKGIKDKVVSAAGEVYLHGKIEYDNGCDICYLSEYPKEDGEYPCVCLLANGGVSIARLFFWKANGKPRGLVVCDKDKEHYFDAKDIFDKREEYI